MQPQLAKKAVSPAVRTFTGWTIVLMVVLRIAIGWHFLYEGVWKLEQDDWRATGYLVNSTGPFRPVFRDVMVNDPDAYELLGVQNIEFDDAHRVVDVEFGPENMNALMDKVAERAIKHYHLTPDQQTVYKMFVERKKHGFKPNEYTVKDLFENERFQSLMEDPVGRRGEVIEMIRPIFKDLDETFITKAKERVPEMIGDKKPLEPVQIVPDDAPVVEEDNLAWLTKGYLHSLLDKRYAELMNHYSLDEAAAADEEMVNLKAQRVLFDQSTWGHRYRDVKKFGEQRDANFVDNIWDSEEFHTELINYVDLCERIKATEEEAGLYGRPAKDYDWERLQYDWKKRGKARMALLTRAEIPLRDIDPKRIDSRFGNAVGEYVGLDLTQEQLKAGNMQLHESQTKLIDVMNMWALAIIGGCLVLGLFTPFVAFCGAGLLLNYYLAMPPWPGYEGNMTAEGHALIVNKNLIEAIALLAICTSRIGHWVGIDAFLFSGGMRRKAARLDEEQAAAQPATA